MIIEKLEKLEKLECGKWWARVKVLLFYFFSFFFFLNQIVMNGPFPDGLQDRVDPWRERSKPRASHLRPKISLIS